MSPECPEQPPQTAEPVELDYAKPVHRRGLLPLWVGISASVIFAVGCGLTVAGMIGHGMSSSDAAASLALGVSLLVFGVGIIASFLVARR